MQASRLQSIGFILLLVAASSLYAQPRMTNRNLTVRPVIQGLDLPISIAFLGFDDVLVLEKNSGKVKRVMGGAVHSTVLDLGVDNASERGLLRISLHPSFPFNPAVYLTGPAARPRHRRTNSSPASRVVRTRTCSSPIARTSWKCPCWGIASIASCGTGRR